MQLGGGIYTKVTILNPALFLIGSAKPLAPELPALEVSIGCLPGAMRSNSRSHSCSVYCVLHRGGSRMPDRYGACVRF